LVILTAASVPTFLCPPRCYYVTVSIVNDIYVAIATVSIATVSMATVSMVTMVTIATVSMATDIYVAMVTGLGGGLQSKTSLLWLGSFFKLRILFVPPKPCFLS
jgi:hypothetical protein